MKHMYLQAFLDHLISIPNVVWHCRCNQTAHRCQDGRYKSCCNNRAWVHVAPATISFELQRIQDLVEFYLEFSNPARRVGVTYPALFYDIFIHEIVIVRFDSSPQLVFLIFSLQITTDISMWFLSGGLSQTRHITTGRVWEISCQDAVRW